MAIEFEFGQSGSDHAEPSREPTIATVGRFSHLTSPRTASSGAGASSCAKERRIIRLARCNQSRAQRFEAVEFGFNPLRGRRRQLGYTRQRFERR